MGDDLEKLFDEFLGRVRSPIGRSAETEVAFLPDIDVIERESEYVVRVELPGISIEDVEVSMVGEALLIRGVKRTETEEKEESVYSSERTYGAFLRTIPFPRAVDAGKIEAKLEKGILEITCPKSEAVKPKKIEVKGETAGAPKSIDAPRPRDEKAREKR
jgi:HSP20 family protein